MREVDYHTFEQPITRNNAELGFDLKFSIAESMMKAEDTFRKDEPPLTIHRGSRWIDKLIEL